MRINVPSASPPDKAIRASFVSTVLIQVGYFLNRPCTPIKHVVAYLIGDGAPGALSV